MRKPSLLAGIVGSVGDSAGPMGTPFWAQVGLLMCRHTAAYSPSNQPHWATLIAHAGPSSPTALALCKLGAGLCGMQPDLKADLLPGLSAAFDRCAAARGQSVAQFQAAMTASEDALTALAPTLFRWVPDGHWLITRGI